MLHAELARGGSTCLPWPTDGQRLGELLPPLTYQANPVDTGRPRPRSATSFPRVAQDPGDRPRRACTRCSNPTRSTSRPTLAGPRRPVSSVVGTGGHVHDVTRVARNYAGRYSTLASPPASRSGCARSYDDARSQARVRRRAEVGLRPRHRQAYPMLSLPAPDEHEAKSARWTLGIRRRYARVCADRRGARGPRRARRTGRGEDPRRRGPAQDARSAVSGSESARTSELDERSVTREPGAPRCWSKQMAPARRRTHRRRTPRPGLRPGAALGAGGTDRRDPRRRRPAPRAACPEEAADTCSTSSRQTCASAWRGAPPVDREAARPTSACSATR